jgi:hypothetical protein
VVFYSKNKSDKKNQSATLVVKPKNADDDEQNEPEKDPVLLLDEDEVGLIPKRVHMEEFTKNLHVGILHTEF